MTKTYKNILVYSGGEAIGDALYKIKFVQNLKETFPNTHITWLAGQGQTEYNHSLKPIISNFINQIIEDKKIGHSPIKEFFNKSPMANKFYDVIIDTQTVVLPTLIVKKIKHNIFISSTANWFFSDLKPKTFSIKNSSLDQRLQLFIGLLSNKTNNDDKFSYNLNINKKYYILAKSILPEGPTYIGISPGAGDNSKKWPLEKFIELANKQASKKRIPVFFIGPKEKFLIEKIKNKVSSAIFPEWTNKAVSSGLKGPILAIALAKQLKVAVANDSGTGHMFAVGGTKLISLFSKHNPTKYAPNAIKLLIIDSKKYGGKDPNLIPLEPVVKSIEKLL